MMVRLLFLTQTTVKQEGKGGTLPPFPSRGFRMRRDIIDVYLPRESKRVTPSRAERLLNKHYRGEPLLIPYHRQLLRGSMRKYVIDKVKKPLKKAIATLANRYPEPTRENTVNPNTHILMDIRDEFLEREGNSTSLGLFKALFRMFIAEYEHDPYYRLRIDWIMERWSQSPWEQSSNCPLTHWK